MPSPKVSIVVIDDEEVMRSACRDVLSAQGYHIKTFVNPEEALQRIRDEVPTLAIVDIMMPRINGLDLVCQIRQAAPSVRILIITGYATPEMEGRADQCGANGFLPKPFTPGELRSAVAAALAES